MKIKKNITIILSLFIIIALYYVFFQDSGYLNRYYLKKERTKLENEIEKINEEIKAIKNENYKLKNDTLQIETYARDNYKMIKPGEITIIMKNQNIDTR